MKKHNGMRTQEKCKVKLLWIILFCPIALFGQQITGIVFDGDSNMPVDLATVYIDGTTVGSTTSSDGRFVLNSPATSGEIVVSHLSYNTEVVSFEKITNLNITIALIPRIFTLKQVSKSSINLRWKNLQYFKDMFLGSDDWGRSAIIENDSVLFFKVEHYDYDFNDSAQEKRIKSIEVEATAPIKISLPKLGYTLQYDLVRFKDMVDTILNRRVISTQGYYYYQPMQTSNRMKEREYRRNRLLAFYYSPQHFIRSFSNNKLLKNGYLLYEHLHDSVQDSVSFFYLDSCDCTIYSSYDVMITGMKDRLFYILYFEFNDKPVDLTRTRILREWKRSAIYFKDDVCIFRKDGSLPGGSVIFDKGIGEKKIGAALPFEYKPDKKVKNREQRERQDMHQELLKKVQL
jgi:hypothetical protein